MNAEPADIGEDRAIEIAREAIAGRIVLSSPSRVTVERLRQAYVVTFIHHNPPGVRGADYDARVTIDRRTGAVIELLGGP